jgi:hypothetical protein
MISDQCIEPPASGAGGFPPRCAPEAARAQRLAPAGSVKGTTMPTNIKLIQAHEFLKAVPDGRLDFEKAKELLLEIASASGNPHDYDIIIDTRKAKSELTITNLWYLAVEVANLRKAFSRKTAWLCPTERFDYVGFFALCAQNRGFRIKAFISFEAAMEWLIGEETESIG